MSELRIEYLVLFAGFVLPGAISMYVYALNVPQREENLKNKIIECICFSILNFIVMIVPIRYALEHWNLNDNFIWSYALLILSFIAMPIIWPYILIQLLDKFEKFRWIAPRPKTSWDFVFQKETGCWLQVAMKDGSRIGGKFSQNSYATAYPDPGHLYLEEVWEVDGDGGFLRQYLNEPGIILRPEDYNYVLVYGGGDG